MFRYFVILSLCSTALTALAQTTSLTPECQQAVRASEERRTPDVYTACGFDDQRKAFHEWARWAEKEKAGQALYEICVRHPGTYQAKYYCQKAAKLENGPALAYQANELYNKNDFVGAAALYTKALASPLLNEAEKGDIAQKMGLLYMNPDSSYYNPQKGMPLIERAVSRRGAEANNLMGVYALFGMQNVPQSAQKSFEYLWRSVLLGCSAAEENLGLWHLAKQKKIDTQTARQEMTKRMFSCTSPEYIPPQQLQKNNCNCEDVAERENLASLYPYRLIEVSADKSDITLQDKAGQQVVAQVGTVLPNGMKVTQIKTKAAFLITSNSQIVLNLAPLDDCPQLCQQQKELRATTSKTITPYHLSFNSKECADILYYAERLVDTKLPFTGKKECRFSADMDKTTDLLMKL